MKGKHILICGSRGIGKSALADKLLSHCNRPVYGFRTKATPRDPETGTFQFYIHPAGQEVWRYEEENHIGFGNEQYRQINSQIFSNFGVQCLQAESGGIILMDELGFMESSSKPFCDRVMACMDGDVPVLAVIKKRHDVDFLNQLRYHPNTEVYYIDEKNREELFDQLLPVIKQWNN